MNKMEKTTSDPRANTVSLPVRFSRANNGKPSMNNFKLTPKNFTQLSECVDSLNWNSIDKVLHMTVIETPKFDVIKWLNFIDEQFHVYQKSPFVDIDTNVILLDFLDGNDNRVATFRFKNLKVESHECHMHRNVSHYGVDQKKEDHLRHMISINYQYVEMVVHGDRLVEEDAKDGEWQTVELPI